MDHEIVEATAANSGEALNALGKLREALQTLPFFGSGTVVWLRDCNFLGEERAASAAAVTEMLASLADELKTFAWQNVRLLISAGKVDKRKTFYKALDKLGTVEIFSAWSVDDKDWAERAEDAAQAALRGTEQGYLRRSAGRSGEPRRAESASTGHRDREALPLRGRPAPDRDGGCHDDLFAQ